MISLTTGRKRSAILVASMICAAVGLPRSAAAATQLLGPFLDCVEPSLTPPNNFIAHFGNVNTLTTPFNLPYPSPSNFYSASTPFPDSVNSLTVFLPGVHHNVVALPIPYDGGVTWFLGVNFATATFSVNLPVWRRHYVKRQHNFRRYSQKSVKRALHPDGDNLQRVQYEPERRYVGA